MSDPRRVCIVTGTRAEYGLLYWTIRALQESPHFDAQLIVTGMHLSPEFGLTYRDIEAHGLPIAERVEMLLSSDTPVGTAKAMGLGLISFAEVLDRLRPDILLLLGDRFEVFAASAAAMAIGIPIAHCSGGELTEGVFDDAIRHSITKMSHLHFTATQVYRDRVIQLGEHPDRVHVVGALGIENINRLDLMNRSQVESSIGLPLMDRSLLVTYHPVTLELDHIERSIGELLAALKELSDTTLIFTGSNADPGGRLIDSMVNDFVSKQPSSSCFLPSMGQNLYLSALKHVNAVVGNSSSGIIEAPSLGTATVNIGDRQGGRIRATSVVDSGESKESIGEAIRQVLSDEFRSRTQDVENPYDAGNSSEQIVEILGSIEYPRALVRKRFFDLDFEAPD